MHATDLTVIGLALDISGAVLLARGFMLKALPDMFWESRTMLDGNVFLLRSGFLQRAEAWGGAIILFSGFFLQILGSMHLFPTDAPRLIVGAWGIAGLSATAAAVFVVAHQIAQGIGRQQFYEYNLRNYTGGAPFTAATVKDKEQLLRGSILYDLPVRPGESPEAFAARLNSKVDDLGTKHRGKVTKPVERAQSWE